MKELAIKIRHRCNTKEIWESANPKLEKGEIGIQIPSEGDANNPKARWFFKFGDGKHLWNELPWAAAEGDVDESLKKEGFAADAKATGDAIQALSDKIDVANYKAMTLTLTVDTPLRERTGDQSVTVKVTAKYSNAKPNNKPAEITAKIGSNPKQELSNFNGKSVTFENLPLSQDFMKTQEPKISFEMVATEAACVGNGNEEKQRRATGTLTFKDSVYYGYSEIADASKLEDTTTFIKSLNKIEDFGKSVTEYDVAPKESGEYFYICCPKYYTLKKLVGGVTAFNADFLGENILDYGNGVTISYNFYRTRDIYTSLIKLTFDVG